MIKKFEQLCSLFFVFFDFCQIRNFFLIISSFLFFFNLYADKALDFTIHQQFVSTRALGMGNAFTAIADDNTALFYNSAALARREDGHLRLFVRGSLSQDVLKFNEDLSKVSDTKDETQIFNFIQKRYGSHLHARFPTFGALLARPGWGIALIPADFTTDFAIHRQSGPAINVNSYLDSTLALSFAGNFESFQIYDEDIVSLGLTVKAIHRAQVGQIVSASMLISDSELFRKEDVQEGLTVDADLGVLWTLGVDREAGFFEALVPKNIGLNVKNVADYGFPIQLNVINKKSPKPDPLGRTIDLGLKYDLPHFWVFDPHFSFEIKDMLHENWNPLKGLHAGFELYWLMFDWWKGTWTVGLNQGHWTAGFGARFAWFQIDLSTWGEEVGTLDSTKENRRYMAELSLDF